MDSEVVKRIIDGGSTKEEIKDRIGEAALIQNKLNRLYTQRSIEITRHSDAMAVIQSEIAALRRTCGHYATRNSSGPDGTDTDCMICGAEL